MIKPIDENLLNKIKEGLIKSGFPLELSIAKTIDKKGWTYSIGKQFLDFETNKLRESDIFAEKVINGFSVRLIIECKKSDEKQLILYQPNESRKSSWSAKWMKVFPAHSNKGLQSYHIYQALKFLPLLDSRFSLSNNIIFTKGNTVEQNNTSFFSSINGMLKRSIIDRANQLSSKNYRVFYLYIIIYEGYLLNLTQTVDDNDLNLIEIDYGQYFTEYNFSLFEEPSLIDVKYVRDFKNEFVIEIMKPSYFEGYIDRISDIFETANMSKLEDWGEKYDEELPF